MKLEALAKVLAARDRIGVTPEVADKLKLRSEDVTRGQLMAQLEGDDGHLGVYLLATYVVDDTDVFGDGEVYWWSIPALVDRVGKAHAGPLFGLPTGMAPHKCGSLEWMTNLSLKNPALLALIPPGEDYVQCVVRVGFYDDDKDPADLPTAIGAGLAALAELPPGGKDGVERIVEPVRKAIFGSLAAHDDDILLDQDIVLRRGEATRFDAGFIGSTMSALARVYYVVVDEARTQSFGPITLHRGQLETVKFDSPIEPGGRLALFARGADVRTRAFGELTADMPFLNRVIEHRQAAELAHGFGVEATGPAKLVAYYTPPTRR